MKTKKLIALLMCSIMAMSVALTACTKKGNPEITFSGATALEFTTKQYRNGEITAEKLTAGVTAKDQNNKSYTVRVYNRLESGKEGDYTITLGCVDENGAWMRKTPATTLWTTERTVKLVIELSESDHGPWDSFLKLTGMVFANAPATSLQTGVYANKGVNSATWANAVEALQLTSRTITQNMGEDLYKIEIPGDEGKNYLELMNDELKASYKTNTGNASSGVPWELFEKQIVTEMDYVIVPGQNWYYSLENVGGGGTPGYFEFEKNSATRFSAKIDDVIVDKFAKVSPWKGVVVNSTDVLQYSDIDEEIIYELWIICVYQNVDYATKLVFEIIVEEDEADIMAGIPFKNYAENIRLDSSEELIYTDESVAAFNDALNDAAAATNWADYRSLFAEAMDIKNELETRFENKALELYDEVEEEEGYYSKKAWGLFVDAVEAAAAELVDESEYNRLYGLAVAALNALCPPITQNFTYGGENLLTYRNNSANEAIYTYVTWHAFCEAVDAALEEDMSASAFATLLAAAKTAYDELDVAALPSYEFVGLQYNGFLMGNSALNNGFLHMFVGVGNGTAGADYVPVAYMNGTNDTVSGGKATASTSAFAGDGPYVIGNGDKFGWSMQGASNEMYILKQGVTSITGPSDYITGKVSAQSVVEYDGSLNYVLRPTRGTLVFDYNDLVTYGNDNSDDTITIILALQYPAGNYTYAYITFALVV